MGAGGTRWRRLLVKQIKRKKKKKERKCKTVDNILRPPLCPNAGLKKKKSSVSSLSLLSYYTFHTQAHTKRKKGG